MDRAAKWLLVFWISAAIWRQSATLRLFFYPVGSIQKARRRAERWADCVKLAFDWTTANTDFAAAKNNCVLIAAL